MGSLVFVDYSRGRTHGGIGIVEATESGTLKAHRAIKVGRVQPQEGELLALTLAMEACNSGDILLTDQEHIVESLLTHGKCAYRSRKANTDEGRSYNALVSRFNQALHTCEGVSIQHVLSHSGVRENVLADNLAKVVSGVRRFEKSSPLALALGKPKITLA